ncbi:glycoside hydrolase family 43 protein [Paenibacillus sp. RRE4]|uniref:glycoside hydrolase family 43 protein n=1 Tax=Paenibacillus sp. RRE4 TaxID=2962587 RepID=UPI0028827698|nr:glycoside hydrolase family 43 protein [Paenibacillus sp. RRE4]MDT0123129.1 glycoside hydrolase family 43 protein [Paenibacillus sp. RRE4]
MKFNNPVISGFHPDPSICNVGEDYYLVNSSFHYFPGVPIFHSRDLVNWQQIGYCLTRPEQLNLSNLDSSMGIFAPTIRYHEGTFYMVTTLVSGKGSDGFGNFYVRASDPSVPWSEPVWLDWEGIDPSLLFDEDGRVYITGTNAFTNEETGIYQAEINLQTGKLLSARQLIWKGTGGKSPEGPHLYNIHGQYYLMISEGGTEYGHMVTVARSANPFGPYESAPNNPVLSHRSTGHPIQATGHADLIEAHDGSWWAVLLGIRPISRRHHLGRETMLAPVTWSEDGWPMLGVDGQLQDNMAGPAFGTEQLQVQEPFDDFTTLELSHRWNFLRNPDPSDWSLTDRPGWLTLKGSPLTLSDVDSPAFIGCRQKHLDCNVSTLLEFDPKANEEAGLTVYMNEKHHYEVVLVHVNGKRSVQLRTRAGSVCMVAARQEYEGKEIVFEIQATKAQYTFSYRAPHDQQSTLLGHAETSLLSTEVTGGFTGVYFGLYATGNGETSEAPAHFDWFDYQT